jgi:hypothetical protein
VGAVRAVQEEEIFIVGGNDHGVALYVLGGDSVAQGGEAGFVVGFVQDQAFQGDYAESVERGDQIEKKVRRPDWVKRRSGVAPAATEDKVHEEKPPEEEDSQDQEKAYNPDN